MAIPHPFKTVRRAGTPSTGGTVMTLQSHVTSPTAHPIYQKKGDAVGNISLAEHNNDIGAHRVHYLRRLELATSLQEYDSSSTVDPSFYSGSNPVDISNIYKSIPTTYLISLILQNPDTYIPDVLLKAAIIDDATHVATNRIEAPSWRLFKEMYDLVNSFQLDDSRNPLSSIFSDKSHRHDGIYSLTGHKHRIDDIIDTYGNIAVAAVNHDHDDRYWLRSEVLETVFDPSVLRSVGIWPNMPYMKVVDTDVAKLQNDSDRDTLDLDLYGTQGNYSFRIDAAKESLKEYHYPESVAKSMDNHYTSSSDKASDVSTDDSLEQTAVLTVLSNRSNPLDFSSIRAVDYLNADPSKSHSYRVVNQTLSVNAPIKKYDRVALGTSIAKAVEQYKDSISGIFWRTGYSLETAWYIDGILQIAGLDAASLMQLIRSGDPVSAIAEHVEYALNKKMEQGTSGSIDALSYISVGFYHPDVGISSEEVVRAPKFDAAIGNAYNGIFARTVETSNVRIVHHDSTNWTIPNKVSRGASMSAESAVNLFDEMKAFSLYSKLLPYRNYYITTSSETILSYPSNDNIQFTGNSLNDEYTYRKNSSVQSYSKDISRSDLKTSDSDLNDFVEDEESIIAYPDEELIDGNMPFPLLAEFRKCKEGTVYLDGVNYYEKDGLHTGTCMTKMKLKTHVVDSVITGEVYRKVLVVSGSGNARQMLRPIVYNASAPEHYDQSGNANYYTYNSNTRVFTQFQPIDTYFDPTVPQAVQVYTPYSIYKVSYEDSRLGLEDGDLLPVTVNNTPMLTGVVYKFFEEAVPYNSDTNSYQFPVGGGVTIIPRVPEYSGTTDQDTIDTTEYKYYTLSGSTYVPITGEVTPSDNLYRLPVDTEGTRYVVAGTKIPVSVNNGISEVHYGVANLKYPNVDLAAVKCKAFFFDTLDTEFVEHKKYFSVHEGKNYVLVTDRTGSPHEKGLAEMIDVEDFFNVAAAVIQLTTTGSNAVVNGNRLVYTIDSSGGLITWDDWQKLITERNIDATMLDLGVVHDTDALWVALNAANANYSIANTFAKAKMLSSTTSANIAALNRFRVSSDGTRLYDTVKDSAVVYLSDMLAYVKKTDGSETVVNGNIDTSYSFTLDRIDVLEQYKIDHIAAHTGTNGFDNRLATVIATVGNNSSGIVKAVNDIRSELGASTNKVDGKTIYSRVRALEEAGGLSAVVIDTEVDLSSSAAGNDVKVLTLGSGEYENFIYSVVLRDNTRNIMIPYPTAEIADPRHTGYVPVYVNASSLIFVKSDGVYLHVPSSWLDIYGGGNDLSVYIRRIPVEHKNS